MAADKDLTDVIETLRTRRSEHLKSAELLDQAIANLTMLVGGPAPADAPSGPSGLVTHIVPNFTFPKSIKQAVLDLLNEAARDWSVDEIINEYTSRGTPLDAKDPQNALFSATSRLSRSGEIQRTSHGRYIATKFVPVPVSEADLGGSADGGLMLMDPAPFRADPSRFAARREARSD